MQNKNKKTVFIIAFTKILCYNNNEDVLPSQLYIITQVCQPDVCVRLFCVRHYVLPPDLQTKINHGRKDTYDIYAQQY